MRREYYITATHKDDSSIRLYLVISKRPSTPESSYSANDYKETWYGMRELKGKGPGYTRHEGELFIENGTEHNRFNITWYDFSMTEVIFL